MEKYLHEAAWEEDNSGATKVYLVKDRKTNAILFFFALKAGLVYKEIGDDDYVLSEQEDEIVKACIEFILDSDSDITPDEVFTWYEEEAFDKEKLLKVIEERSDVKREAKLDRAHYNGRVNEKHVLKTFPGIVLTHFCRNEGVTMYGEMDFPLGFYVFWEIIALKVLEISKYIGCQYLYLFAADQTENQDGYGIEDLDV